MQQLLKKEVQFDWTNKMQEEFEDIKAALAAEPVLGLPTQEGRFRVYTDFCAEAIAAVLHQKDSD